MTTFLPNIRISKEVKNKNKFDLSFDIHSTSDWGFCYPYFCKEMIPNSSAHVQVESFVRNSPMVAPTMARIKHKLYHNFVSFDDLISWFPNFLSQVAYSSSTTTRVPISLPRCSLSILSKALVSYCNISFIIVQDTKIDDNFSYEYLTSPNSNLKQIYDGLISSFNNVFFDYRDPSYSGSFDRVTIENCDFSFRVDISELSSYVPEQIIATSNIRPDSNVIALCSLQPSGRRIYHILNSLGYRFDYDSDLKVSLLPLFAYYRTWFDLFAPKRDFSFETTNCHKLLFLINQAVTGDILEDSRYSAFNEFSAFFDDLKNCWYSTPADFVNSHTSTLSNSGVFSLDIPKLSGDGQGQTVVSDEDSIPKFKNGNFNALAVKTLLKLYKFTNKNSVIGKKIEDYIRVNYGESVLNDFSSSFIGSEVSDVIISDVINSSDTFNSSSGDGSHLGEYGGKGTGYSDGKVLSWDAKSFGFWICLGVIIPESRYSGVVDNSLLHNDFYSIYNPSFDSLGYEVTPLECIYGGRDISLAPKPDGSFGYIPRFANYKVSNDIVCGDFSRRSLRDVYSPYHLDRIIIPSEFVRTGDNTFKLFVNDIPRASTEWSFLAKYPNLSNFNRIFVDGGNLINREDTELYMESLDHFIVHCSVKFDYIAPMLSISESYDTIDGNDTVDVENS